MTVESVSPCSAVLTPEMVELSSDESFSGKPQKNEKMDTEKALTNEVQIVAEKTDKQEKMNIETEPKIQQQIATETTDKEQNSTVVKKDTEKQNPTDPTKTSFEEHVNKDDESTEPAEEYTRSN